MKFLLYIIITQYFITNCNLNITICFSRNKTANTFNNQIIQIIFMVILKGYYRFSLIDYRTVVAKPD